MTIYSWGQGSPIEKLQIVPFGEKGQEGVLYASSSAAQGQLAAIPDMFRSLGMNVVPDMIDGQYVLRVHGFEAEEMLPKALEENGFAPAASRQQQTSPDVKKDKGKLGDRIRKKSLTAAGYVYLAGDAALIAAGLKRKDFAEAKSGLAFASSSVVFARYGEKKVEKAFGDLHEELLAEFAREGVEIPKGEISAEDLGKPGGIIERVEKFIYNRPSEVNSAINLFAGWQLFQAGKNQSSGSKSMAGVLVMAGMLTGLLVPEKAAKKDKTLEGAAAAADATGDVWKQPEVEEEKTLLDTLTSPVRKLTDWVQESPLRARSYLVIGNNVAQANAAWKDRNDNKTLREALPDRINAATSDRKRRELTGQLEEAEASKSNWMFNMAAVSAYMVANGLVSISSKDTSVGGTGDDNPMQELYAAASAILAGMPAEARETMTNKMAHYLASHQDIGEAPDAIAQKMREKTSQLENSPWLAKAVQQAADNSAHQGPARA